MPLGTERQGLLWLIALSILLRVGSAVYLGNEVKTNPGIADQVAYHTLAHRVLEGEGFTFATGWWPATQADEPTSHWSFLYVLLLSAFYSVADAPLAARLFQAVAVGILQPLLIYRIARRWFPSPAALLSAAIVAVYAYFVYYSAALMTESLYICAVLWALDSSAALIDDAKAGVEGGRSAGWFRLGAALALATLLRQPILLFAPLIVFWTVWRMSRLGPVRNASSALRLFGPKAALVTGCLAAAILPWTIRNYAAYGRFVLLQTNAGFAFYWGNHPIHGREFVPILGGDGEGYGQLIPGELRGLNEAELERELLTRGVGFVRADPMRYLALSVDRLKEYVKFWPSEDSSRTSNYARVLSFGLALPFMLSGLVLTLSGASVRAGLQTAEQQKECLLLTDFAALYTLLHLATWTLIRYRLPVDAVLIPFASLGALYAAGRIRAAVAPYLSAPPVPQSGDVQAMRQDSL